jgi:glycosyltransferase involved in cell wall biosynthesis
MTTQLSIVTPTLNAAAYLEQCLASVAGQAVEDLEHIVVDGGSSDATQAIARRFPGVIWISRPGSGQTAAINAGLQGAQGDVVAWLNADDAYTPGALQEVVERFSRDPGLDLLYGDCQVVGPLGQTLWWERPGNYDFGRLLRRGNYIAQPAVFLRKRVFASVGYLDESLEYGMDYDLWLRLRGHTVAYVPRTLARFRWHTDSKSARGQARSWNEFLRIVRRHGGGWTPHIAMACARCLVTVARVRLGAALTGSIPLRPLTRRGNFLEGD